MSSPGVAAVAGERDRWSPITPDDHGGILWIVTILAGIYSALTLLLRLYIKRTAFGLDDCVFSAATVLGISQHVAMYVALSAGLGRSATLLSNAQTLKIGEAALAAQILLILALCLSKNSVVLLVRRLFAHDMDRHRVACAAVLAVCSAWGFASVLAVSVGCSPRQYVNASSRRSNHLVRWQTVAAFDAVTEVLIVALSVALVWQLQMKLDVKARVVAAFMFRLPLVALSVLTLHYSRAYSRTSDPGVGIVAPVACLQAELLYSLVSATIPNLRSFVQSFHSGMGIDVRRYGSHATGGRGSGERSFRTGSVKQGSQPRSRMGSHGLAESSNPLIGRLRPEQLKTTTTIHHPSDGSRPGSGQGGSGSSHASQEMIIRRDVMWNVQID